MSTETEGHSTGKAWREVPRSTTFPGEHIDNRALYDWRIRRSYRRKTIAVIAAILIGALFAWIRWGG